MLNPMNHPHFDEDFRRSRPRFVVAGAGDGMPVWLQHCGRGLGPHLGPGDPPKVGWKHMFGAFRKAGWWVEIS